MWDGAVSVTKIVEADFSTWKRFRALFIIIQVFVSFLSLYFTFIFDSSILMITPLVFTFLCTFLFLSIYLYFGVSYLPEVYGIDTSKSQIMLGFLNSRNIQGLDICSDARARIALVRGRCFQLVWICWAWFVLFVFLLPAVLAVVAVVVHM